MEYRANRPARAAGSRSASASSASCKRPSSSSSTFPVSLERPTPRAARASRRAASPACGVQGHRASPPPAGRSAATGPACRSRAGRQRVPPAVGRASPPPPPRPPAARARAGARAARARIGRRRLLVGELPHGLFRGAGGGAERLVRHTGRRGAIVVVRQIGEVGLRIVSGQRLQGLGDRAVQRDAAARAEIAIERLADQGMGEGVPSLPGDVLDESCGLCLGERVAVREAEVRDALEEGLCRTPARSPRRATTRPRPPATVARGDGGWPRAPRREPETRRWRDRAGDPRCRRATAAPPR